MSIVDASVSVLDNQVGHVSPVLKQYPVKLHGNIAEDIILAPQGVSTQDA